MLNKDIIISVLSKLNSLMGDDIKLGFAGSYARGNQKNSSDLDVVVTKSLPIESIELIKSTFNEYGVHADVLSLDLLLIEDIELDSMLQEIGFDANDKSVYKNVIKETIWI